MIEIDILTIDYVDGVLSFKYTLDGEQLNYKNKNNQSGWTVEELKELASGAKGTTLTELGL